jgi:hypothetical protein
MNPRDFVSSDYTREASVMVEPAPRSQFDLDLENAEQYYGRDTYPGNGALTCQKCGAVVGLGWQHIEWHEEQAA